MTEETIRKICDFTLQQERCKTLRVLYLDLDGTVRHGYDELGRFVNTADDVVIFPEAVAAMKEYKAQGWKIAGVSNQGGIALGHLSMKDCLRAMVRTQELTGDLFDKIAFCRHHPDAKMPSMAQCWCRKPKIGLVIECAADIAMTHSGMCPPHAAVFVGDSEEDRQCAENAGIRFLWAKDWRAGAR